MVKAQTMSSTERTHPQKTAKESAFHDFVFLIGPGGVGKTTTGKHLSDRIGYDFVDLDEYFCSEVANIRNFISDFGYREYVIMNSRCFNDVINKCRSNTVISLSSGFLIFEEADEVVEANREYIRRLGVAVLLVPSLDHQKAADIVAKRQVGRGFGLNEAEERKKFLERIKIYEGFSKHTALSGGCPADTVDQIAQMLDFNIRQNKGPQRLPVRLKSPAQ